MTNDLSHFVHFANSSNRYGVAPIRLRFTLFRVNGWATFLEDQKYQKCTTLINTESDLFLNNAYQICLQPVFGEGRFIMMKMYVRNSLCSTFNLSSTSL